MRLLLMRHCEAVAGADNDPDRPLTAAALEQLHSRAMAASDLLGEVERVVTSPWRRAVETAAALSPFLSHATLSEAALSEAALSETSEALLPQAGVESALALMERFAQEGEGTLLVIGHQPLLGRLIGLLCEGPGGGVYHPGPGAVAVIELDWPATGLGSLRYWCQL